MIINKTLEKRLCLLFVKYSPLIQTLALFIYVLFIYLGYNNKVIELLFSSSLFSYLRLISASIALEFCKLHRYFITYNLIAYIYIIVYSKYVNCVILKQFSVLLFIIGILLFIALIIKLMKK